WTCGRATGLPRTQESGADGQRGYATLPTAASRLVRATSGRGRLNSRRTGRVVADNNSRRLPMVRDVDTALGLSTLLDPTVWADPYPFYHELRSRAPVHWDESAGPGQGGAWVLSRHADVLAVLRDARVSAARLNREVAVDLLPEEYRAAALQVFRAMPH